MDLLNDNKNKKPQKTKGQKIVLTLLIISIILCIVIGALIFTLDKGVLETRYTMILNGQTISENDIGLLQLEDGSKYISIKKMCSKLEYDYYNGEYEIATESKDKGYIDNKKNIIQFYSNSNEIFKTKDKENRDYERYTLSHNIIQYNEDLYVCIDDLAIALNVIQQYSEKNNQTIMATPEYWLSINKSNLDKLGYTVSEEPENITAIAYGYVIVKYNNKFGVIDLEKKEIIGCKYNDMTFVEYTGNFIVSNNNDKYGIINIQGNTEIELQYDSISVLNFDPLLYQVEKLKKYGIMREDGSIINQIQYSSLGYPEDTQNNIDYTLIIPELNENIPESIVVKIDNSYGLIELETGKEIIPCELNGIFLVIDQDLTKYYVVRLKDGTLDTLENYIKSMNFITVNVNE